MWLPYSWSTVQKSTSYLDVPFSRLVIEVDFWAIVQVTSCRTLVELMRNEREMLVFAYDPLSKYIKYPLSKP
jgi:hypothetical protein